MDTEVLMRPTSLEQQKAGSEYKSVILYPPEIAQGKLQKCPAG